AAPERPKRVRAVATEDDPRVLVEPADRRSVAVPELVERQEASRQRDPAGAGLEPADEDVAPRHAPRRLRCIDGADGYHAVEHRMHAAAVLDVYLGVRMESAVDLVVVNLHGRVPAVDELS